MTVSGMTRSVLANGVRDPAALWRLAGILCLAAIVAIFALFFDTVAATVQIWTNNRTFNHGFLILPIVGYLVWQRQEELASMTPRVEPWGLVLVAVAAFGWLLGSVAGVQAVEQLSLVAIVQATVFTILGRSVTKKLIFPLAYLYFAVPIGQVLVPPLQDVTAVFSVALLRLVGVPVYLDGVFISIPTANFEVAEACAGVRFLIAMVALGALYAHLMYRSWPRRIAFMALSIVVPIIANGFRAFGIILIADKAGVDAAVVIDHVVYGWLFFVFVMFVTLGLGMLFREDLRAPASASAARPSAPTSAPRGGAFVVAAVAVLIVAAAAPTYGAMIAARPGDAPQALAPPAPAAAWRATDEPAQWRVEVPGAERVVERTYARDDRRVRLAITYLSRQMQGAEVVADGNSFLDDAVWLRLGDGSDRVVLAGRPLDVAYTRYMKGTDTYRLVWRWYWIDGRFTANPYLAKLYELRAKLLGGVEGAAIVTLAADYGERREDAVKTLRDFVRDIEPLDRYLARLAGRADG